MRDAAVYIVPLRIGGGTRLKIFEAMAMSKAVVSTTIGAEGLPVTNGEHVILANEPHTFARAVLQLLRDGDRRRQLEALRAPSSSSSDWAAVSGALETALQTIADCGCGMRIHRRFRSQSAINPQSAILNPHCEGLLMRVSVFGLGYVGSVSAASFAADGHEVIGVDVNADKVATVNAGRSPIVEPGLDDLLQRAVSEGRLRATSSTADAIAGSDVSLLCVGTPSRKNGSLDLTYLERVAEQIGVALKDKPNYHVVVVRSTVLPGTTHEIVIPALERESGKIRRRLRRVRQPEFLREHRAQGFPQAAARWSGTTTPPMRAARLRCISRSTRRSSAPASASPR